MPLFPINRTEASNRQRVKIVKAVNGGEAGHRGRKNLAKKQQRTKSKNSFFCKTRHPLEDFWDALDEQHFARQHPSTEPVLRDEGLVMEKVKSFTRGKRRYSAECYSIGESSSNCVKTQLAREEKMFESTLAEQSSRGSRMHELVNESSTKKATNNSGASNVDHCRPPTTILVVRQKQGALSYLK